MLQNPPSAGVCSIFGGRKRREEERRGEERRGEERREKDERRGEWRVSIRGVRAREQENGEGPNSTSYGMLLSLLLLGNWGGV